MRWPTTIITRFFVSTCVRHSSIYSFHLVCVGSFVRFVGRTLGASGRKRVDRVKEQFLICTRILSRSNRSWHRWIILSILCLFSIFTHDSNEKYVMVLCRRYIIYAALGRTRHGPMSFHPTQVCAHELTWVEEVLTRLRREQRSHPNAMAVRPFKFLFKCRFNRLKTTHFGFHVGHDCEKSIDDNHFFCVCVWTSCSFCSAITWNRVHVASARTWIMRLQPALASMSNLVWTTENANTLRIVRCSVAIKSN